MDAIDLLTAVRVSAYLLLGIGLFWPLSGETDRDLPTTLVLALVWPAALIAVIVLVRRGALPNAPDDQLDRFEPLRRLVRMAELLRGTA